VRVRRVLGAEEGEEADEEGRLQVSTAGKEKKDKGKDKVRREKFGLPDDGHH